MTKARKPNAQYCDNELWERARRAIRESHKLIRQTQELVVQSAQLKRDFPPGLKGSHSKLCHRLTRVGLEWRQSRIACSMQ
jgi:hypothetical protein